MGFLTPALLAGIGLIAVPIVLHLVMRRQPRQHTFPALRFVKQRQEANRRRLNFRHLLLLALRCLLIAGIAFALARPTLSGSGLRGKEGQPLAVALVMDNSLRMQYVQQNETRLSAATDLAKSLVEKLPADTEIAVVDLSRSSSGFVVDSGTAEARIQALGAESDPRPLAEAISNAVRLVAEEVDRRQEVFVFSDLSATAFEESALASISQAMAEAPDVRIYLVDVGSEETRNLALAPIKLSASSLRPGEAVHVEVEVRSVGYAEQPLVEIFLADSTGTPQKRGERIVELNPEGAGHTEFVLGDLPLGTHQGYLQLGTSDPLEFDNRRYFTVEVRPAAKVLLLGESDDDLLFLGEALCPSLLRGNAPQRYELLKGRFSKMTQLEFNEYDAVCLLDPPPLSDEAWNQLYEYARKGGGVGIFLGNRATASGFKGVASQQLLPGTLKLRSRRESWLRPQRLDHPALAGLKNYAEAIPWQMYPVWMYWEFDELAGDSYIVARYANHQPAIVERPIGQGRTLTFTTPVSDPLEPVGREPWNMLPTGPEPWPFVALANQTIGYLALAEAHEQNIVAGETVGLRLSPRQHVTEFVLKEPGGTGLRRTLPAGEDTIRISTTNVLGNYRVASGGRTGVLDEGFSVNALAELSRLERADEGVIAAALPADRVHLAQSLDDVEEYVDIGRSGRELFPWVISLVALIWSSEHLLANRFYREERQP